MEFNSERKCFCGNSFHVHRRGRRSTKCFNCRREEEKLKDKLWKERNRERLKKEARAKYAGYSEEQRAIRAAKSRARYVANREREIARSRAWQAENQSAILEWKKKHKEKLSAQNRAWAQKNRKKIRAQWARWYAANSDKSRANWRAWYAGLRNTAEYNHRKRRRQLEFLMRDLPSDVREMRLLLFEARSHIRLQEAANRATRANDSK